MKVSEVMVRDVQLLTPEETVQSAAQMMAELDADALAVGSAGRIEGILTDRDIIVRVVAHGRDATTTLVRQAMSSGLACCRADAPAEEVMRDMLERQIRRMPVLDGEGRLLGMVTLAHVSPPGPRAGGGGPGR